mmetsp:Transcript_39988/g.127192  ORF Transcript_39988/g.127192 Transcript_39988/m.127192 type:complete len:297 (+) Transcript_39988:734-1624(+)
MRQPPYVFRDFERLGVLFGFDVRVGTPMQRGCHLLRVAKLVVKLGRLLRCLECLLVTAGGIMHLGNLAERRGHEGLVLCGPCIVHALICPPQCFLPGGVCGLAGPLGEDGNVCLASQEHCPNALVLVPCLPEKPACLLRGVRSSLALATGHVGLGHEHERPRLAQRVVLVLEELLRLACEPESLLLLVLAMIAHLSSQEQHLCLAHRVACASEPLQLCCDHVLSLLKPLLAAQRADDEAQRICDPCPVTLLPVELQSVRRCLQRLVELPIIEVALGGHKQRGRLCPSSVQGAAVSL